MISFIKLYLITALASVPDCTNLSHVFHRLKEPVNVMAGKVRTRLRHLLKLTSNPTQ